MATAVFSLDRFLKAPPLARAREIEEGLPASALRALIDGETITLADLVGVVGSRRTLDRRLADDARLTLEESDRLARFVEVLALAGHVLGGRQAAMAWLRLPKKRFDGARPLDLIRTHSGSELVTNFFNLARHGMLA